MTSNRFRRAGNRPPSRFRAQCDAGACVEFRASSRQVRARLVDTWGPPRRTEIIYNAVPPSAALSVAANTDTVAERPPQIAMIGRLIPLKRVDGIVRMLASIPNASMIIVGDGPERQRLTELTRTLGLENRVRLTGALSPREAAATLAASDLLVLNSTTENCPHVVLEALALGVPVVATPVGGVPELIADGVTGLLAASVDSADVMASLRCALADEPWRRRASRAALIAARRFSWEHHADAVDAVLRRAATL
jgi:glycosyltransferase involved in cell wall biosynthesis